MYEERERFSIKDFALQIILVVLFVFLLLWLFPTKSYVDNKIDSKFDVLYNQIFTTNINNMKEAAISYYTTSRLPKNIGDKEKLTLGEMLDKKLLISFFDSNNKQCSLTDSYVEITKMDDEYILKVNLSCSDNSDYILVHLGCYNYCESGLCEKKEATQTSAKTTAKVEKLVSKNYEYEYEKVVNGKWGDWSNWSEWSTTKADKTNYRDVKTKEESVVTGEETIKVGTKTNYTNADSKTTYTCPSGYKLNGTTCTKQVEANSKYTCPDGFNLNGTECTKEVTGSSVATINATVNYTCPSDYTLDGTTCSKSVSSSINATLTTSCPSGYTQNGDSCSKQETIIKYYKQGSFVKTVTGASSVPKSNSTYYYVMTGSDYVYNCDNSCAMKWIYTYNVYKSVPEYGTKTVTASLTNNYTCPSGYSLSGTSCYKNIISSINATANYTCPSGYTQNGTQCSKTFTSTATAKVDATLNYSCESGYTRNGNKCVSNIDANKNISYSCKKGTQSGKYCLITEDVYETFNTYSNITYYSYREREYISGDRKTVWSKSNSDQSLFSEGYSLTGRSREI